jgi:hypothetical protein
MKAWFSSIEFVYEASFGRLVTGRQARGSLQPTLDALEKRGMEDGDQWSKWPEP